MTLELWIIAILIILLLVVSAKAIFLSHDNARLDELLCRVTDSKEDIIRKRDAMEKRATDAEKYAGSLMYRLNTACPPSTCFSSLNSYRTGWLEQEAETKAAEREADVVETIAYVKKLKGGEAKACQEARAVLAALKTRDAKAAKKGKGKR